MTRKQVLSLLMVLSLVLTMTQPLSAQQPSFDPDRLWQFAADLSAENMKGRLTGTPDGLIAESYVLEKMEALKLKTVTQTVTFPLYELMPGAEFSAESAGTTDVFEYIKDYREVDYTGSGRVSGDAVFVGFGIETPTHHSYEGVDVKGKIAVMLIGIPDDVERNIEWARLDRKVHRACEKGAVGVVFIPKGAMAQAAAQRGDEAKMWALGPRRAYSPEYVHRDVPGIFLHAHAVQKLMGDSTAALVANPASRSLNKRLTIEINSRIYDETSARNVIGILPGSDAELKGEAIVIGAHYDHLGLGADGRIFYGAADNAAGTAAVMEAAAYFSGLKERPKRTLVFALWCGEEQGLWGSKYYVEEAPLVPLEQTVLMIQLDYLGHEHGPCLSNVDDNALIQKFVGSAIADEELMALDWGGRSASDDQYFLTHSVPAYRFIAYGTHHHRSSDTIENLSRDMLNKTTEILVKGILNTAY